jgi:AcrR family transcriptional regulator
VTNIAVASGVATGTVYLYFPSKDHILLALHTRLGEGQALYVAQAAAETVEGALAGRAGEYGTAIDHMVDAIVAHTIENRRLVEVCARYRPHIHRELGRVEEPAMGMVVRVLEEGVRLGLIHASDPEMTAHLLDSAISETLEDHIIYGDPPDLPRLVAATKELLRKALAPEPVRPTGGGDSARSRRRNNVS